MTKSIRLILLAMSLSAVIAAEGNPSTVGAAEIQADGYMGNRSGVYADAKPPVVWSDSSNVLWKVPVPNLGNAGPCVAGDRVIVLSEPGWKHDFPVISCYALADGKLLWEKEIDHLALTVPDAAAQKHIREVWHKHLAWHRDYFLLYHDWLAAKGDAKVKQRMDDMGVLDWGGGYVFGNMDKAKDSEFGLGVYKKYPELGKALIDLDTWRRMGSHDFMWMGEVFATPCTDGKGIYVATAWGVTACYELDGTLRWMKALPVNAGEYCSRSRSPILYADLVISDQGSMVRAFDRKTGEMKWEHQRKANFHEFVSPVLFKVGNQDLLWCAGTAAYTLPEGKALKVEGWQNNGMIISVNTDKPDTIFFTGGGQHGGWERNSEQDGNVPPAAVRFSLSGDTLSGKVLWCGLNGKPVIGCTAMVYHDKKLYISGGRKRGNILDAETGVVVKGLFGGSVPVSAHQVSIADGKIYCFSNGTTPEGKPAGVMNIYLTEGIQLATDYLSVAKFSDLSPEDKTKRLSQWFSHPKGENKEWCFTFSALFSIAKDRILIRSLDHLYCIGKKDEGAIANAETLMSEGEKNKNVWGQLAALGPAAKAVVPRLDAYITKKNKDFWIPLSALMVIAPEEAKKHTSLIVQSILDSRLDNSSTPLLGGILYNLGTATRAHLKALETAVDARLEPLGGPGDVETLIGAHYRRSGEVGFTKIHVKPYPSQGGPERGKDTTLIWNAANATKVRIEPDIGEVAIKGEKAVQLQKTQTYTFTAEGPGGPSVRTVTIPIKVAVKNFRPSSYQVAAGTEITLTWQTSNTDSVTISGLGKVDPSGEKKLTIDKTTEFTIEAIGPEGPATQKVTVTVK